MLDWIAGFVGRWAASVPSPVRDLVHWAVHALAGVVYAVFGNVGRAWHDMFTAFHWVESTARDLVIWVVRWLTWLIRVAIPRIDAAILAYWRDALRFARTLYDDALAGILRLSRLARQWVDDALKWVRVNVWDPLLADVRQLRADLLKWGYFAYQLVTHPSQLAAILGDALISWAEQQFWRIAGPAGTFALRLVAANVRKFAQLAETILAAVL